MNDEPVKGRKFIVAECIRASVAPDPKSSEVVITLASGAGVGTETGLSVNEASALGLYLQKMSSLGSEVDAKISDEVLLETCQGCPVIRLAIDDTVVAWLMTRVVCAYLGSCVLEVVKEQQVKDAPKAA